jgi:hypothetical protein
MGLACSVLIALVVVTFDEATTQQWLLSTLISLATKWFTEPLQALVLIYALGFLTCKKKKKLTLKEAASRAKVGAILGLPSAEARADRTVDEFLADEAVGLGIVALYYCSFASHQNR